MEGADFARPFDGNKAFWRIEKIFGRSQPKGVDITVAEMEASGLLTRKDYAEVPPRVEYTLTELGYSLQPVLEAMRDWGEAYKKKF